MRFVQELTGKEIAGRLGIATKAASNEATIVQGLIADGFGALILLQEGRVYCPALARILDSAASPHRRDQHGVRCGPGRRRSVHRRATSADREPFQRLQCLRQLPDMQ